MITRAPEKSLSNMILLVYDGSTRSTSSSEIMSHFLANTRVRTGNNGCFAEQFFIACVLCFDEVISGK
jgi:hypothetical protein